MQSYDNIEGFEYWNIEAWKIFIQDNIAPLSQAVSVLLSVSEYIAEIIGQEGGRTLSEIEEKSADILPYILGGIAENGEYRKNSLAKLTRMMFGFYVSPREWITLEREEGIQASDYVNVKVEGSTFLQFLKKINDATENILRLGKVKVTKVNESEVKKVTQNPQEALSVLQTIYERSLRVSANHNYYTFFIISTKLLPWRFMKEAYPMLKDNFDLIRTFLGLEKFFEPKINEEKKREDYALWGHSKESLSAYLYDLNQAIWECFADEKARDVFGYVSSDMKDLRRDYAQRTQRKLEETKWSFPPHIEMSYGYDYRHIYVISGPFLSQHRLDVYTTGDHPWVSYQSAYQTVRPRWLSQSKECNIPLFELFDEVSPALFLGVPQFELKISNQELEIVRR